METDQMIDNPAKNQQQVKKVIVTKKKTVLKKLDPESARILQALKEKANKKIFGRKVRDAEIIEVALRLVTDEQINTLQEKTFSEKDRLSIAHADFVKSHGKITLDQFIGKLLKGELKIN